MSKVLVFGSFDGIHDGHRAMLKEAKALGDHLLVSVAQDNIIQLLKNHLPKYSLAERIAYLKKEGIADEIVAGDKILAYWTVVKNYQPDIIALGYDQHELKTALETYFSGQTQEDFESPKKRPKIVILQPYKPTTQHSSILNN